MHLSIKSHNDQSSRRGFKAIGITMLEEEHVESYCSFVCYGNYLYQKKAIRHKEELISCFERGGGGWSWTQGKSWKSCAAEIFKPRLCLRFWRWFVLFYMKNQIVFQTNIAVINTMEKLLHRISNINCSSLAFTVFLRLPAQKYTVHDPFKRIYC